MTKIIVSSRDLRAQVYRKDLKVRVANVALKAAEVVFDPDTKNRYFRGGHERNLLATMVDAPALAFSKSADRDSTLLVDAPAKGVELSKDNILDMQDSPAIQVDYVRAFADAFTLDDNATVDAIVKDFFGAKTNVFGFSDTQAFGVGKNLTDSFSNVEAIDSLNVGKGLSDTQSMTEVLSRTVQYARTFTDTFVMDDAATVDAFVKDTSAAKTNIYTMGDVFNRTVDYNRTFTDTYSPTEAHAVSFSKSASDDSFSMSENLSRAVTYNRDFADSFSNTEAIDSFVFGKGLADSQAMTEAHASSVSIAKTDSTSIVDAPAQSFETPKADSFSFSDTDSRVVQFVRTFTDAFTMDDAATVDAFTKDYSGDKSNIFTFADSEAITFAKALADAFAPTDDPDLEVGKGLSDSVTVTENFSFALFSNAALNAAQLNLSPFNE